MSKPTPDSIGNSGNLILASSSPRRLVLLRQLGLEAIAIPADIDEEPIAGEKTSAYVVRLSLGKARKVANQHDAGKLVLGADTVIDFEGQIMGKPGSLQQSLVMLGRLSGQTHQVMTGVTLICGDQVESVLVRTEVTLDVLSKDQIEAYWATGEPQGKAGSYAIQGVGARYVSHISGSYSNVVGLPLFETAALLTRFDCPV